MLNKVLKPNFKQLLLNSSEFDPTRDGKVPARRNPFALGIRLCFLLTQMLASPHPKDALVWLKSMYSRRHPLSYPVPWLTFDSIREIEKRLSPGSQIFEYGAGHSTVYWAEKDLNIVLVEDNPDWFKMVEGVLRGRPKVKVCFESAPDKYVNFISLFSEPFDVVIVDGSHRKQCVRGALSKLKPGGLLVVDNTDWHWFQKDETLVPASWEKMVFPGPAPFIGHLSETTLWLKPFG
jgi:hypothetical protein